MSRPGILRAQQQAAQITADIKSGQAFVAATSEQKKTTFACPVSQTQRRVSGGMRKSLNQEMGFYLILKSISYEIHILPIIAESLTWNFM